MAGYVVVGCQWGDEGKGKVVDLLGTHMDMVVRFQGGNNAGHTVVVGDQKVILRLLPSGILSPEAQCVIGAGVVVDPFVLLKELASLSEKGFRMPEGHLMISDRAHLLMPYHRYLDELEEADAGAMKIGTTKNGIGPCYADKYNRTGIRMCDFRDREVFNEKLKYILEKKNREIVKLYGGTPFDYDELVAQFDELRTQIAPMICDAVDLVNRALDEGKNVLFEGAQANMLPDCGRCLRRCWRQPEEARPYHRHLESLCDQSRRRSLCHGRIRTDRRGIAGKRRRIRSRHGQTEKTRLDGPAGSETGSQDQWTD